VKMLCFNVLLLSLLAFSLHICSMKEKHVAYNKFDHFIPYHHPCKISKGVDLLTCIQAVETTQFCISSILEKN
jgi:hypothetical protein